MLGTLGAAVLALRRRNVAALSFTAFALSLAALYLLETASATTGRLVPQTVASALALVVGAGAVGLMLVFPTPLAGKERPDAGLALAAVTIFIILGLAERLANDAAYAALWSSGAGMVGYLTIDVLHGIAFFAAMVVFPLRARRLPAEAPGAARSLAIVAVGIFLFTAGGAGALAAAGRGDATLLSALGYAAYRIVPVALWVLATRGHHAGSARNVALAAAAIAVGALLLDLAGSTLAYPIGRIVGSAMLAYAILRGQLPGLDVKVRFAISKSTIAAAFIAVFFLASEVAQQFFGAQFGSAYVGIAAAGMLVFALAPLQRAAERLAEKAVPTTQAATPASLATAARGADSYRRAVRLALKDRRLTHAEEVELAIVAHDLGLSAPDAMRVRLEVERELRADGGAGTWRA